MTEPPSENLHVVTDAASGFISTLNKMGYNLMGLSHKLCASYYTAGSQICSYSMCRNNLLSEMGFTSRNNLGGDRDKKKMICGVICEALLTRR
jgi:hypothetical protein